MIQVLLSGLHLAMSKRVKTLITLIFTILETYYLRRNLIDGTVHDHILPENTFFASKFLKTIFLPNAVRPQPLIWFWIVYISKRSLLDRWWSHTGLFCDLYALVLHSKWESNIHSRSIFYKVCSTHSKCYKVK